MRPYAYEILINFNTIICLFSFVTISITGISYIMYIQTVLVLTLVTSNTIIVNANAMKVG